MLKPLVIFLTYLVAVAPAYSLCGQPQPRLICEEYSVAPAVVIAELIGVRHLTEKQTDMGTDGHIYRLRRVKVIRGRIAADFAVFDSNDSARSVLDWHKGKEYLLFLHKSSWRAGYFDVDGCGSSVEMSHAKKVLDAIHSIQSGETRSFIRGFLEEYPGTEPVDVRVYGKLGNYETRTDGNGEFTILVPPGHYRAELISPGKKFGAYFIAYEDPENINIPKGGCSLLAFEEISKK